MTEYDIEESKVGYYLSAMPCAYIINSIIIGKFNKNKTLVFIYKNPIVNVYW